MDELIAISREQPAHGVPVAALRAGSSSASGSHSAPRKAAAAAESSAACRLGVPPLRGVPVPSFEPGRIPSSPSQPPARRAAGSPADGAAVLQLFVRRPPEEYSRLESVESTLTARLRRQGVQETQVALAGAHGLDSARKVKIRVHLPPYDSEASVAVIDVPVTMRVEELRKEVTQNHAAWLGPKAESTDYELRLYDEDEKEPEYDCPPFDKGLQLGALNVTDVALCGLTPRSPPISSPVEEDGDPSLSAAAGTPQALGGLLAQKVLVNESTITPPLPQDLHVKGACGAGHAHIHSSADSCNAKTPQTVTLDVRPSREQEVLVTEDEEVFARRPPVRKVSDPEVVSRIAEAATEPHRFSHRRCRSSPQAFEAAPVIVGFEQFSKSKRSLAESEASRRLPQSGASAAAVLAVSARAGVVASEEDATPGVRTRQLQLILPDGPAKRGAHLTPIAGAAASANAVLAPSAMGGGTISAFAESVPCTETVSAAAGIEALTIDTSATTGERSQGAGDSPLLGPDAVAGDSTAEPVALEVREDATLCEVLEQLKQQRGRAYDPVNFAFERMDDGICQRLDLDMQVKQLQPHSNLLTIVRKDAAPVADAFRLEGLHDHQFASFRRPPPSAFFFTDYTASIPREYFVTAMPRGSRARPVQCNLVVDREHIFHQPPRTPATHTGSPKKSTYLSPLFKKLGQRLQLCDASSTQCNMFSERRISEVRSIWCDECRQRTFFILFAGGGTADSDTEFAYQAQTPTECAEIVARVQYLLTLTR